MKSTAESPPPASYEPDFILHLDTADDTRRLRRNVVTSVVLHIIGATILVNVQFAATPPRDLQLPQIVRRVTPLIAPPPPVREREVTQKAPNKAKVSPEIDLQGLIAKEQVKAPPSKPSVSPKPTPGIAQP